MSRMIHSGDISYSSINAPNYKANHASNTCYQSCFLNFPYATITSTFMVISGLIISIISILHLAGILDRLAQDLFYKRYLWVNELKVILLFIGCFISVIILVNLIIGFATSSLKLDAKVKNKDACFCSRHSTTNCLIRFIFLVNLIIFITVLLLLILFCIFTFVFYVLTTLCNNENGVTDPSVMNTYDRSFEPYHTNHVINLQPFAPMLSFSANETHLLLFKDNRLKTLCRNYVATLTLFNLIALLGIALLFFGYLCYLINLTVNRIRIATFKKYTELLFLNSGTELSTFHDSSYDNGDRF